MDSLMTTLSSLAQGNAIFLTELDVPFCVVVWEEASEVILMALVMPCQ